MLRYYLILIFALSATPIQHQRTVFNSIGEMQIVNRPRKEGPPKSVMLLSQGSFEECDAAKPGKNVMQQTQVLNAQTRYTLKGESVLQLKLLGAGPWGHSSKPAVSLIFNPEIRRELSPLPLIWSTGTNITSLPWQQQPLWRKTVRGTGKEPPSRTHVISDDVFGKQWEEKTGSSGVHVVVAKESDVTERMIHTGGEQIQGNETRNFRDRVLRIGEKKRGGGLVGKLDSTSSLRLDKDPRWAQKVMHVQPHVHD